MTSTIVRPTHRPRRDRSHEQWKPPVSPRAHAPRHAVADPGLIADLINATLPQRAVRR